jgi:ferrous iron transport protein A
MTLDQLPRGSSAVITALDTRGAERHRLMDLGLLPGSTIRPDLTSPLGDPTAFLVRDSLIVLRRSHTRAIQVEPVTT